MVKLCGLNILENGDQLCLTVVSGCEVEVVMVNSAYLGVLSWFLDD